MMTQYPNDPYQPQPGAPDSMVYEQQNQKTSGLAIASLVCSLICCLPGLPLIGTLLGIFAAVSISRNPARRGMGLAIAGIIIGLVFTAGQAAFIFSSYYGWQEVRRAPGQSIAAGYAGDYAQFRQAFANGNQVTDAEAQAFIDELRTRYGDFVESDTSFGTFVEGMQGAQPGQMDVPIRYTLIFADERVTADFYFRQEDQVPGTDELIFRRLHIIDPQRGDLFFPPEDVGEDDVDAAAAGEIGAEAPPEDGVGEANDGPPQPE